MNELRSLSLYNYEYSNNDTVRPADSKDENFKSLSLRTSDETDEAVIGNLNSNVSVSSFMKMDPLIWIPPEPANIEDDMDSIAYNDEDDEDDYNDGTKWRNSTSLNDFDKQNGNSYKEARQKAMVAAMNGQFKILVNRFLASEGLASSNEGDDVGWLDIVTFLSWESALFIKPDAKEGRAMDPGSYIKVKCVAAGDRSQSKVIKGLVFKKNTAHKHMPTKLKNPRLLLVKGNLGPREFGLSSFDSMDQEKNSLKFVNEMIESCHPNLVLVEKSVSRDIQEFLLAKGMTLATDMKLTRLERIARCTGSHVVSSADSMTDRYVKQCDTFRIEKFFEEHNNSSDVGRKSSKTLMFLEGFAKPLGCTILLKGAPTDELKRVKRVIQYTIFAAYHLILETSFFADQRALFSKIHASSDIDGPLTDETLPTITSVAAPASNSYCLVRSSNGFLENSASKDDPGFVPNNGFFEDKVTQGELPSDSNQNVVIQTSSVTSTDLSSHLMSSFSASLRKLLSENYTSESISSFFGFKDECESPCLNDLLISPSARTTDNGREENEKIGEEMIKCDSCVSGRFEGLSTLNESTQLITAVRTSTNECDNKDENDNILSPESILVLLSSQCIEKGLVCEQSHLSRIKYYGNFDISLGRYLQDVLLNQQHSCSSCGEPPEAHIYCYTHQNGNLTVLVKQLTSSLSGEAEGKIWMWSRCLKCEHEKGIPRSTTRVVMSSAARSLSFGKFLELSFTSHSAASRLCSECGHSLHRDCLRFFGLGSKVAMFRYSPVEIYAACKPLPVLEFPNLSKQEWVALEAKSVIQNVDNFFSEVASFLHNLKISCPGLVYKQSLNFPGIVKSIADVEEMLNQEKVEFEASLLKIHNFTGELEKPVNEIPNFSWFYQELIFWLFIWDSRLHQLLQCSKDLDGSLDTNVRYIDGASKKNCDVASVETTHIQKSLSNRECNDQTHYKLRHDSLCNSVGISQNSEIKEIGFPTKEVDLDQLTAEDAIATIKQDSDSVTCVPPAKGNEDCGTYEHMHEDCSMGSSDLFVKAASSDILSGSRTSENGFPSPSLLKEQHSGTRLLEDSSTSVLGDPDGLIWVPFPELRKAYRMDLCGGYLQKFDFTRTYAPKYLSPMHHLLPQERGLLHYHFPANGNIICVSENEISSVIACALALSEDQHCFVENIVEKDAIADQPEGDKENDGLSNLQSECSSSSTLWPSNGSLDSVGGIHHSWSLSSLSLDELSTSASESTLSWDRPLVSESLHPAVSVGIGKDGSKRYSVVCIHAKEFYALRRMCCPSEQAYISSLSRCRNWDAQGGKSKAFFAKSMDERFIIKQIKKAELDSFLKFSGDYFKHITHSLSSGSQTCLAKILGIYQVKQNRNGKEVKIDLMVMENLLFGHNVTRTYDLKGAVFSRFIADTKSPEKVLLDQNFMEDMRLSPIYVGGRTKHLLQRAIWNDTSFLNAINVMDYSLLVGVDKQQRQLVFGIIDYLRQYTWDKQLETWVKASLVVPKNSLPTIISPKEYKKRFRKFMSRYLLTVPDSWCSTQCSDGCKSCAGGSICSSKTHGADPQGCEV